MTVEGLNDSERYLAQLAKRAFLNPWSYPNIFINKGGAKELADLVVVFGKTVIVFSDKLCEIKPAQSENVAWGRWHRTAVEKSVKQLVGAKRIIGGGLFEYFTDASFKKRLDMEIPRDAEIILVAVAKRQLKADVAGSDLRNRPLVLTNARFEQSSETPFEIGMDFGSDPFVHIIDEHSLDALLNELDTVTDFVSYLRAKEKCFRAGKISRTTDPDLMAHHFRNYTEDESQIFKDILEAKAPTNIAAADWDAVRKHMNYASMKHANRVSYAWDVAINYFYETLQEGPLRNRNIEMLREMACETRFQRRILSERMHRGNEHIKLNKVDRRITPVRNGELLYVFVVQNMEHWKNPDKLYNRQMDLDSTVRIALSLTGEGRAAKRVVGIAYNASPDTNYDFMMLGHDDVTSEDIEYAKEQQREQGILANVQRREVYVDLSPPFQGVLNCKNCGPVHVSTDHFKAQRVPRPSYQSTLNRKARRAMLSNKR